jgi:pentatricopeptide repeat protein
MSLEPNIIIYSTLIKGFARSKDLDSALEILAAMKSAGIEPNQIVYNTLLD